MLAVLKSGKSAQRRKLGEHAEEESHTSDEEIESVELHDGFALPHQKIRVLLLGCQTWQKVRRKW